MAQYGPGLISIPVLQELYSQGERCLQEAVHLGLAGDEAFHAREHFVESGIQGRRTEPAGLLVDLADRLGESLHPQDILAFTGSPRDERLGTLEQLLQPAIAGLCVRLSGEAGQGQPQRKQAQQPAGISPAVGLLDL
jgi:hypothetical protein